MSSRAPRLTAGAVAHMQQLLDEDKHEYQELVIGGDTTGLLFRRKVLAWVEAEHGDVVDS